jgi:Sec-independent protein translocase protein TatA
VPAFIQNINPTELLLIAVVAILVFGRRLPEVAGQAASHVQRARRAFNDLRRETGIDDEIREARRTFEQARYEARLDPSAPRIQPPSHAGVARGGWPRDAGEVAGPQGDPEEREAGSERPESTGSPDDSGSAGGRASSTADPERPTDPDVDGRRP